MPEAALKDMGFAAHVSLIPILYVESDMIDWPEKSYSNCFH